MTLEFYIGKFFTNLTYWRLRAANGKVIADGAQGYKNARDAEHGAELALGGKIQTNAPTDSGLAIIRYDIDGVENIVEVKFL